MSPAAKKQKTENGHGTFVPPEGAEKLTIFDTSLRDGEQSPGVSLNVIEKVEIAKTLSRLGVDVCEAGFPIASDGDFEAVHEIARIVGPMTDGRKEGTPMRICGLARAKEADVRRCAEAIAPAPRRRIHTFLATSDIHLKYKLKISREECIKQASEMVALAKSLCDDVEFSPEDAGRSDRDFMCQVLSAVIEAGASTLNIPDTVGYNLPSDYAETISYLRTNTKGGDKVTWSTHCHNDLGLATANTIAGVQAGARQVEVTINGIGERAGNTSLEEVVMAIATHQKRMPVYTTIDSRQLLKTSRLIRSLTGMSVQPNKAIVGDNAFAHEAGIHQDGMLKNRETYEIMHPEHVGWTKTNLVMGKHSGKHALKDRVEELGYTDVTPERLNELFVKFKALADAKKSVTDFDLHALMKDEMSKPPEHFKVLGVQVSTGDKMPSTATVSIMTPQGEERTEALLGRGPVDAIYKTIDKICQMDVQLADWRIHAATGGEDALGEVSVKIRETKGEHRTFSAVGAHNDVLLAAAYAYVNAMNKYYELTSSDKGGEKRDSIEISAI
eukprot:Clim_evm84s128 gene=Clim_evmTU84s128